MSSTLIRHFDHDFVGLFWDNLYFFLNRIYLKNLNYAFDAHSSLLPWFRWSFCSTFIHTLFLMRLSRIHPRFSRRTSNVSRFVRRFGDGQWRYVNLGSLSSFLGWGPIISLVVQTDLNGALEMFWGLFGLYYSKSREEFSRPSLTANWNV